MYLIQTKTVYKINIDKNMLLNNFIVFLFIWNKVDYCSPIKFYIFIQLITY